MLCLCEFSSVNNTYCICDDTSYEAVWKSGYEIKEMLKRGIEIRDVSLTADGVIKLSGDNDLLWDEMDYSTAITVIAVIDKLHFIVYMYERLRLVSLDTVISIRKRGSVTIRNGYVEDAWENNRRFRIVTDTDFHGEIKHLDISESSESWAAKCRMAGIDACLDTDSLSVVYKGGKLLKMHKYTESLDKRSVYSSDIESIKMNSLCSIVKGGARNNLTNLRDIEFSSGLLMIDSYSFAKTSIESLDLSMTNRLSIRGSAFRECNRLKIVKLGKNTDLSVDNYGIFMNCSSLESIDFAGYTGEIPRQAFCGCYSLKEIRGEENITALGVRAFAHCTDLKTLGRSILNCIGDYALSHCGVERVNMLNPANVSLEAFTNASVKELNIAVTRRSSLRYIGALLNVECIEALNIMIAEDLKGSMEKRFKEAGEMAEYNVYIEYGTAEEAEAWIRSRNS